MPSVSTPFSNIPESVTVPMKPSAPKQRRMLYPNADRKIEHTQQNQALMQAAKHEAGGNAVLQSILEDTARTTLPAMMGQIDGPSMNTGPGFGAVEMAVSQSTPEQLFGEENMSKWSMLAFMPKPGPKVA